MRKELKFILIVFLLSIFSLNVHAAKRYWIKTTAAYWNNTANWSSSSGGAGGFSVPGSSDTAFFNGSGVGNDTIDANVNIKRLDVASGFTGKIIQRTFSVTIGSTGATLAGGTFSGGSGNITASGAFTISGTAFTSTSGIFSTSANFTWSSGSFTHNNGKVKFTATNTITLTSSVTFYDVEFSPTANSTYTIASGTMVVNDSLTTTGGSHSAIINTGAISAKGDIRIYNTSTASGGSATITINGTSSQSLTGNSAVGNGPLCKVVINKSGTLSLYNTISVANNWTWTAGTIAAGSSTVVFYDNSMTISGTHSLNNVTFYSSSGNYNYAVGSGNTLTVNGTLTLDGTSGIALNTGTINAKGNITILNNYNASGGNGLIVINGSGTQKLTGGTTSPARLPSVTINKTSTDTLKLVSWIPILGNWTYTSGRIDAGTSLVQFITSKTISGTQTLHDVGLGGNATFTISSGSTLTTTGTLTFINNVGPITINTGTINAKGDISLPNVYTGGGGSAAIVINGTSDQTITGNSTDGASALPNVTINKSTGKLFLVNTVSVAKNWTWTSGTVDAGTSMVYFITTKTIKGSHSLFNVTFDGSAASTYTIATGTTFTVKGTLLINGSNIVKLDSGTVNAQGNITVTNTATGATGNTSLVINGTGIQTITGSGTAGQGRLPAITLAKTFGETDFASIISIYGGLTYTLSNKVDAYTNLSTVDLYGNFNLDAQGSSGTMGFYNLTIAGNTTTLTGDLSVLNNLTINSTTTLSAGSNGVTVGGNWVDNGTWTYATSSVTFNGSGNNTIAKASGTETFYDLGFNRTSKYQKLNNPVTVNHTLTLTKGHVISDTVNYLLLIDNATLSGGAGDAYVHGPVRKTGNDAFTFPLGDTSLVDTAYHPLSITAPSSTSDQFQARYFALGQTVGDSLVDSLENISDCEYWTLKRTAGSSTPYVTVGWNKNSCNIDNYDDLRLAQWNGTKWLDLGASSVSVTDYTGLLTGHSGVGYSPSNPTIITIGKRKIPASYAVLLKKLDGGYYQTINGKLFFKYDEEYNDADGLLMFNIYEDNAEKLTNPITSSSFLPTALQQHVQYGSNYYQINTIQCDFTNTGGYLPNGFYILEVINEKNEHWYLRFKNYSTISVVCGSLPD